MHSIPLIAAGQLVAASLAACVALYQAWLARARTDTPYHQWAVGIAGGAAISSAALALLTGRPGPSEVWGLTALLYSANILVCHCLYEWSVDLVKGPSFGTRRQRLLVLWAHIALVAVPGLAISVDLHPIDLWRHPDAFQMANFGPLGLAWPGVLSLALMATWRLAKSPGPWRLPRAAAMAVGFWGLTGLHDLFAFLEISAPPMLLMPLGFLAVGGIIMVGDLRRYVQLLHEAEAERQQLATGHAAAVAARKISESSFRQLVDALPIGVAILQEGQVVMANPALAEITRYEEPGQLLGQDLNAVVAADDLERVQAQLGDDPLDGMDEDTLGPTLAIRPAADPARKAELSVLRLAWDGRPAHMVLVRDVTARQRNRAEKMRLDRLSIAGTLAAGVGHELNNPLAALTINLDLLRRRLTAGAAMGRLEPSLLAKLGPMMADSEETVQRMGEVVRELRLFTSTDDEKPTAVNVDEMVRTTLRAARHLLRTRASIIHEAGAHRPVLAHRGELGQVLLNLLINAAHAFPEGVPRGLIRIETSVVDDTVRLELHDTGTGIAPEQLERVFDPFASGGAATPGLGIGLAVCQEVIRRLGGTIHITSQQGEGTQVTVGLPAAPSHVALPQTAAAPQITLSEAIDPEITVDLESPPLASLLAEASRVRTPPAPRRLIPGQAPIRPAPVDRRSLPKAAQPGPRKRVLVIDDEPVVARALGRVLRKQFDVQLANNADDALSAIAEDPGLSAILCDLSMPKQDGVDFYHRLAAGHPALIPHVVFITGGVVNDKVRVFLTEVDPPRLLKPIEPAELRAAMAEAAAR